MATHDSPHRFYRHGLSTAEGEVSFQVVVEQTDLFVTACRDLHAEIADYVHEIRGVLKTWIGLHPEFGTSLAPLDIPESAPAMVRAMADAALMTGVGPMAAVAGTVAQLTADRFADTSPDILVENGGDVFMHSTRDRTVSLLAEPESGARLGLSLAASDFPLSLCSSSGTIGHSLSLGRGDLVVVRARSASLADAAATSLANMLRTADDLTRVTDQAEEWAGYGVEGVFAQCAGSLAVQGKMELVVIE